MLGILAREKDGFAQKKLLEGLEDPEKALVPPEKALQLLSYDVHAEAYPVARAIVSKPPNADRQAGGACGCSRRTPARAPMFERILRDKDETAEIRQISASALQALKPEKLQEHAREIVLDTSEYDEIQATSLTALTQFGDDEAVGDDEALLKRVGALSGRQSAKVKQGARRFLAKYGRVRQAGRCTDVATTGAAVRAAIRGAGRRARRRSGSARAADRSAARRSSALRPARRGDDRSDARLGPARARARRGVGRRAPLRARRARHRRRSVSGRGGRARPAVLPEPARGVRAVRDARDRQHPLSRRAGVVRELRRVRASRPRGTSPVRELLATLAWLGPHARGVLPEVEALRAQRGGLSRKLLVDVDRAVEAIRGAGCESSRARPTRAATLPGGLGNTLSWARGSRRGCEPIEATVFEDHDGASITFEEFFRGHPSHRRLLLHALRQPAEVLADGHEARAGSDAAGGAGTRRADPHRGDHLRSRRSIFPSAFAATGRTAACAWTPAIECCERPTASTRCAATSGSASISSSRW